MKPVSCCILPTRPLCAGLSTIFTFCALSLSFSPTHAVGQESVGTIKGRLVWGGAEAPKPKVLEEKGKAAKDPGVCAKNAPIISHALEVDPKTKGIANAFVYLFQPKGSNPEAYEAIAKKTPEVVIDQLNCDFIPHVVAITQDQPILFKSSDPTGHNIHLTGFIAAFNQMVPPKGQLQQKLVAEKRPIQITCDIHGWMKGYAMVFDHPFFAVTGKDGSFEIKGVPAGAQKIVIWQETVGYATSGFARGQAVQVEAGKTVDIGDVKLDPAMVKE